MRHDTPIKDYPNMVRRFSRLRNLKIYDLRNLYNLDQMKDKKIKYYSVGRPNIN